MLSSLSVIVSANYSAGLLIATVDEDGYAVASLEFPSCFAWHQHPAVHSEDVSMFQYLSLLSLPFTHLAHPRCLLTHSSPISSLSHSPTSPSLYILIFSLLFLSICLFFPLSPTLPLCPSPAISLPVSVTRAGLSCVHIPVDWGHCEGQLWAPGVM